MKTPLLKVLLPDRITFDDTAVMRRTPLSSNITTKQV